MGMAAFALSQLLRRVVVTEEQETRSCTSYRQLLSWRLMTILFPGALQLESIRQGPDKNPDCVLNIQSRFPLLCSLLIYTDLENTNLGKKYWELLVFQVSSIYTNASLE